MYSLPMNWAADFKHPWALALHVTLLLFVVNHQPLPKFHVITFCMYVWCSSYLQWQCTPLHLASEHGHEDVVSVLLQYLANTEAQDNVRNVFTVVQILVPTL